MTIEDLMALFAVSYDNETPIGRKRAPQKPKKSTKKDSKKIYTSDELDALRLNLQNKPQEEASDDYISTRYLVTLDKRLLMAREGVPDHQTPVHGEMAIKCLTAGNLFFNPEMTEVIAMNHQSGDFEPPISSLVFALQALVHSGIPVSEEFFLILSYYAENETKNETIAMTQELSNFIVQLNQNEPEAEPVDEAGYLTP